jgi:hypothetical protein
MGWVSILEDALERIQDSIRLAETALDNEYEFLEVHRKESLRALNHAQAIFVQAWKHLELATDPEVELAHENKQLTERVRQLQHKLETAEAAAEKARHEAANHYAVLQDARREIADLKKRYRKLEKELEKVARTDFGSVVEAFSSPGMIKKHKPDL